jgi:hypothetical protein
MQDVGQTTHGYLTKETYAVSHICPYLSRLLNDSLSAKT